MRNTKDLQEQKRRNERSGEKINRGGGRFYTVILPTEFPTDHRIIFFWVVALNSVGIVLNFALKF
jgi:hypothetical protein